MRTIKIVGGLLLLAALLHLAAFSLALLQPRSREPASPSGASEASTGVLISDAHNAAAPVPWVRAMDWGAAL